MRNRGNFTKMILEDLAVEKSPKQTQTMQMEHLKDTKTMVSYFSKDDKKYIT